jgi:hypothetical protein
MLAGLRRSVCSVANSPGDLSHGALGSDPARMNELHQSVCGPMALVAIHFMQDHVKTPHRAHRIWRCHA